eukprot:c26451_g1_i1 orf=3-200(-)
MQPSACPRNINNSSSGSLFRHQMLFSKVTTMLPIQKTSDTTYQNPENPESTAAPDPECSSYLHLHT